MVAGICNFHLFLITQILSDWNKPAGLVCGFSADVDCDMESERAANQADTIRGTAKPAGSFPGSLHHWQDFTASFQRRTIYFSSFHENINAGIVLI